MENKTSYKMFVKEMVIKHLKLRVVYKDVSYAYQKRHCLFAIFYKKCVQQILAYGKLFAPYVIDKILYTHSEMSLKFYKSKQLESFLI